MTTNCCACSSVPTVPASNCYLAPDPSQFTMLDRIFGFFGSSQKASEPELKVECFECRMVGGTGLTGLGGYIVYYAFQKRNLPTAGRFTMFASSFLGSVIMTLGLLRLAGIHDLEPQAASSTAKVTKKDSEMLND